MPKVITLAKTKELLGIDNTDLDTEITRYIPIIDSKVKQMTKNRYNFQVVGQTVDTVTAVELFSIQDANRGLWNFRDNRGLDFNYNRNILGINNPWTIEDLEDYLEIGSLISGEGIPADTYIDEVYFNGRQVTLSGIDYNIPTIVLSNAATATATDAQIFIGFNIGLQTTIAKGIAWLIGEENQSAPSIGGISSKRIGSISITYGDKQAEIDGKWGMPNWFVKAFPVFHSGH